MEGGGVGHRREEYRRLRTLLGADHKRLQQSPPQLGETTALADRRGDRAGMKACREDITGVEPRRQLPGEQNIAELGTAISSHHRPIPRAREIADVDTV